MEKTEAVSRHARTAWRTPVKHRGNLGARVELRIDQPKRSTSSDNGNDAGQRQLAVLDADPDHFVNMKVYREFDGVVNAGTVVSTDEDIATGRTLWSVQYDDGVQAEKDLSVRTCFELHKKTHAAPTYGIIVIIIGKVH